MGDGAHSVSIHRERPCQTNLTGTKDCAGPWLLQPMAAACRYPGATLRCVVHMLCAAIHTQGARQTTRVQAPMLGRGPCRGPCGCNIEAAPLVRTSRTRVAPCQQADNVHVPEEPHCSRGCTAAHSGCCCCCCCCKSDHRCCGHIRLGLHRLSHVGVIAVHQSVGAGFRV
jgi:hypothetical protein